MKKYHYTYMIIELDSCRKYIGVRSSDNDPKNDLGIIYFSSSRDKEFIHRQKTNPDNYNYYVIDEFKTRSIALAEEIRLHEIYSVGQSDDYINIAAASTTGFTTYGRLAVKDKLGNRFLVKNDDPRLKTGELVPVNNIRVKIDGVIYESVKTAKIALSICNKTIKKRCNDVNYTNYEYV